MTRSIPWSMLAFLSIILAISINILFGLVKLINLLNIEFYYFYSTNVIDIVIFSPLIDLLIWFISLLFITAEILLMAVLHHRKFPIWMLLIYSLLIASLMAFLINDRIALLLAIPLGFTTVGLSVFYYKGFSLVKRVEGALLILTATMGLLIPFELASLSSWIVNAFDYEVPFGSSLRWRFPYIDLQLFNVLYPLIPWLFLIILFCWIWIPALKYVLSRTGIRDLLSIRDTDRLNNKFLAFSLLLSLALTLFIAYYPYIHLPSTTLIGVDSIFYYDWLKEIMQKGPFIALEMDRPLFNLLMYFIKYVTDLPPYAVVRILSIILAISLPLAVFLFVKVGTKDERLALLSAFLTSFSFQTTVSIFAYSLANWFAMIEIFLLLAFLFKSLEERSWIYSLLPASFGMALLLTHPYTWYLLMIILASYLIWILLRKPEESSDIFPLEVIIISNLLFYMVYTLMPFGGGVGGSGVWVSDVALSNISISNLLNLMNGLTYMVQRWVGGLFGNPPLMILAIIGIVSMLDFAKRFNRIMLLWVMIPSLALFFVSPESEALYYRLVYLIPFQILAAMGLKWILDKVKDMEIKFKIDRTYSHIIIVLMIVLTMLLLFNYSLRSVDEAMIYMPEP
ncbi:MAG: hypothetical protein HXX80_01785 [Nitrososphaerales archaeon]|nr:hypothetical protein [Nitrososphaerales archaeon]